MAPGRCRDRRQRQRDHGHAGSSGRDDGRRRQLRCGHHQRPRRRHQRAVCAFCRGRSAAGGGVGFLGGGACPRAAGRCHRRHGRATQQQRHHAHAHHGFRFERLCGRERHFKRRRGRARRPAQSRRGRLGVFCIYPDPCRRPSARGKRDGFRGPQHGHRPAGLRGIRDQRHGGTGARRRRSARQQQRMDADHTGAVPRRKRRGHTGDVPSLRLRRRG